MYQESSRTMRQMFFLIFCVNLHSACNMQGVQTDDTSTATSVDYNMCTAGTFIGSVVGSKLVQCSSFSLKMTALDELYLLCCIIFGVSIQYMYIVS